MTGDVSLIDIMQYIREIGDKSKDPPHGRKSPMPDYNRHPSRLWYVVHVPFGFVSGPACHDLWEDRNPADAERHMLRGIVLGAGAWFTIGVALLVSGA